MISPEYKDLIQRMHRTTNWGDGAHRRAESIVPFVRTAGHRCTVLDYGCGKGTLKPALLRLMPALAISEYDPGIPGKDVPQNGPFDLVVSTDVLEHIEPEHLPAVLTHIKGLAPRAVIFIGLGPAKKILPDGRNAHLIQMPPEWWEDTLRQAGFSILESRTTLRHLQLYTESLPHE